MVGGGGIESGADAISMIMAGATCVQLLTAAMLGGISVFNKIDLEIRDWMKRKNYSDLSEFRGTSLKYLGESNTVPHCAIVNATLCNACGRCQVVCPHDAIHVEPKRPPAVVTVQNCAGCGLCWYECPIHAIELKGFP